MKRLVFLCLTLLYVSVLSASKKVKVDGIYYYLNDDMTASVTNDGIGSNHEDIRCYTGAIIIPSTITYDSKTYRVSEIYIGAFAFCHKLTSVYLPPSIISIGDQAFRSCSNLKSVNIPNAVSKIKWETFAYCSKLTAITIPNSISSIGRYAFAGCVNLTSLSIPKSVNMIGYSAFEECKRLNTVTILPKYINLEGCVFNKCSIKNFYCSKNVDVSKNKGNIKNLHYLNN